MLPLKQGDIVWIPDHKCTGKVVSEVAPRSYTVQISQGTLRINRRQFIMSPTTLGDELYMLPDISTSNESASKQPTVSEQSLKPSLPPSDGTECSKSRRTSRPPQRYRLDNS